ncbi:adhesin [Pseudomonas sp. Z5-35]|uniref:CS1 type fimbrial major subunit n=1 Tax=unclassified Pseudomonas TaxID=196821 RepID=UPI003DA8CADB
MFKQMVSLVVLAAAVLGSSPVLAADDARTSIHITANIPNKQFHVQPRDPEFGKNEVMLYNEVTQWMSRIRHTYDVKNTDGSVHAYILEGHRPWLSNGRTAIELGVTFNDVRLRGTPLEVVDDASSTPGTQAEMVIFADGMPADRDPGVYIGSFTVIFDAVPRVAI